MHNDKKEVQALNLKIGQIESKRKVREETPQILRDRVDKKLEEKIEDRQYEKLVSERNDTIRFLKWKVIWCWFVFFLIVGFTIYLSTQDLLFK